MPQHFGRITEAVGMLARFGIEQQAGGLERGSRYDNHFGKRLVFLIGNAINERDAFRFSGVGVYD